MCGSGRIKHHLRYNISRPECAIVFVGFQAAGTLGRRIVEGAKSVRIFRESYPVRAKLFTINGLSAHADRDALLGWIGEQPDLDADRIMIYGGSYGGHMTLATATRYSDGIACSVNLFGISNLRTFLENTQGYRRDLRRAEYGDERDPKIREFFQRISPLSNASKITKPLFVIQGKNDPRVPYTESEQMVATVKKNGSPVWYLVANDEGHGFAKKKNADFQLYATIAFHLVRQVSELSAQRFQTLCDLETDPWRGEDAQPVEHQRPPDSFIQTVRPPRSPSPFARSPGIRRSRGAALFSRGQERI